MKTLSRKQIVSALRRNAANLRVELWRVEAAIAALGDVTITGKTPWIRVKGKSKMSAKARAAIGRAQRARWAKLKAAKGRK
ncbi:MAG: hypothetical protein ABSG14_08365 [Verrucomicrobiia bacterium]|jgi:hypothetical protein